MHGWVLPKVEKKEKPVQPPSKDLKGGGGTQVETGIGTAAMIPYAGTPVSWTVARSGK